MIFSKRHKLAKEFEEWAKDNNVSNCAENVIAYLDIKGELIDSEPKIKYIDPIDYSQTEGEGSPIDFFTIEQLREMGYETEDKNDPLNA